MEALLFLNRLLFVDTDALTTKFYAGLLLASDDEIRKCNALVDAIHDIHEFNCIFFLEPTVTFVQDGTRNEEIMQHRNKYSEQLKAPSIPNKVYTRE